MESIKAHPMEFYKKFSFKSMRKEWRWRIKARNGNIIASSSEGYINRLDCIYNAKSTAESIKYHFRKP